MDVQQALSSKQISADDVVVLELEGTAESKAVVHLHGATVLSWVCGGKEQFFVSSKSHLDNQNPIRGGIPVVFPNFGPWTLGPMHGFARVKKWTVAKPPTREVNGQVVASFGLKDDEETYAMWANRFQLTYTVTLTSTSLTTAMAIHNTGTDSFDFTFALHTYFQVADIKTTSVQGLNGLQYIDKMNDSKERVDDNETVTIDGSCARVYKNTPAAVTIVTEPKKRLQMTTSANLSNTVVWNPWEQTAKGIPDLNDDGWRHFVCVEAAVVTTPVVMKAGEKTDMIQTLAVLSQ